MRLMGTALRIQEIENMIRSSKNGIRVKVTSGKRGDYAGMGATTTSELFTRKLSVLTPRGIKLTYDNRSGEGIINIKDDDVGQICAKVPGLLGQLGMLKDIGDNDQGGKGGK